MKRRTVLAGLVALPGLAVAAPALAHRGHAGLTVIEIDAAGGGISVVHRFYAHDVEPALVTVAPDAQPSLDDPRALEALVAHLSQRFRLEVDGHRVAVSHGQTHLAGDNMRFDFIGSMDPGVAVGVVTVDLDFFPGVHDDWEQQVNVRTASVTRTVVFRPGSQAQSVRFRA